MTIKVEPTKINIEATEYADLRLLVQSAIKDYDAFWASLSHRDRDLTKSFACSDTCDTVFVFGDHVYELVHDEQLNTFDVYEIGLESDFELYVNAELIGGDVSDDEVSVFIAELQKSLPGLRIKPGQASNGCSTRSQWLADNCYLVEAWTTALAEI